MREELQEKLACHISQSGNYEALVVRPHPAQRGKYEILNGYHRWFVLKKLGYERVKCDVWEVSDTKARVLLATLNRLEGEDVPERRAVLISLLQQDFSLPELAKLLPENLPDLKEMQRLWKLDLESLRENFEHQAEEFLRDVPKIVTFVLNAEQANALEEALTLIAETNSELQSRASRLEAVCRLSLSAMRKEHK